MGLGARWLRVWGLDPLGECCCLLGGRHWRPVDNSGMAVGEPGRCARPGKHPWWVERDGQVVGFRHGALEAVAWERAAGRDALFGQGHGAGTRLAVVPGGRVMVLDLDSPRAMATFCRLAVWTWDWLLGAAKTPRGYHVWLRTALDGSANAAR